MEKKFDVIPIEDYGVVVNDSNKLSYHDWYVVDGKLDRVWSDTDWTHMDCPKVVATINKRIDDIPLIQLEPTWDKERQIAFSKAVYANKEKLETGVSISIFQAGYDTGYKAAQKKYSEEDMKKMFHFGRLSGVRDVGDEDKIGTKFNDALKLLQPKLPKSVVLKMEYETIGDTEHDEGGTLPGAVSEELVLKITIPSTNTIIPISYE